MDNTRYVVLSDGEDVSYAAVFKDGKLIGSHEQLDFLEELVDLGLAKVYNTSNPKLEKKFTPVGIDKITTPEPPAAQGPLLPPPPPPVFAVPAVP